ncbi:TVP38/TMEM64 family protein [Candidatus Kaiserbacteria bacterium]|nr:TVP38/TMEM64 family protein [Candidatus Kaiserbacteria bacterium]
MEEFLTKLFSEYPTLAPALFVAVRAIAVIIPPIPGILTDLIGILMFGWIVGLVLGEVGIILGSLVTFWLARRFRKPLVKRFTLLRTVEEWEEKYSERQKFWALVAIRLVAVPFFDHMGYVAGLTKMRWSTFLFSTVLGTFPLMFLIYYFGGLTFNKGVYFGITFVIGLTTLGLVYKNANVLKYFSSLWAKKE